MKVFKINDFVCCKFHLLLSKKKYEKFSKLIMEHGGEVVSTPEDNVFTFTESKHDFRTETYQLKYITDCIEAGKLLDLGDYTWDKRKNYGCAMSLLLFGEKHCESFNFLRRSSSRSAVFPPRISPPMLSPTRSFSSQISPSRISPLHSSPPRISSQRNDPECEINPKPSTSQITVFNETVKTPAKSQKAEHSEVVQLLEKLQNDLLEPKVIACLEKRGVSLFKKKVEKEKVNHKAPDPQEVPHVRIQIDMESEKKNKEPEKKGLLTINIDKREEKERRKKTEERKEDSNFKMLMSKGKERNKIDLYKERMDPERRKSEKALERKVQESKERLERKSRQEKEEQEKKRKGQEKNKEAIKSPPLIEKPGPSITKIVRIVCPKLVYSKSKDSSLENESNKDTSFDELQTQTKSNLYKDTPSKRTLTSEDLEENLPLNKRCKNNDRIESQTLVQKKILFRLNDPQDRVDFQSLHNSSLQGRTSLKLTDDLRITSVFTQNPSGFSQDSVVVTEDSLVFAQASMGDLNDELFRSEEFTSHDEFVNQRRLESEEDLKRDFSNDMEIPPNLTQAPTEVDEIIGSCSLNLQNRCSENKNSSKSLHDELESAPLGLSHEINSHSQDKIQQTISQWIEDQDKIQEQENERFDQEDSNSKEAEEEPSPLLDQEDLQLLMDDSETDFLSATDADSSVTSIPVDSDVQIIVKEEPNVETFSPLHYEDNIANEEPSQVNNIDQLKMQRIPKEVKNTTSSGENEKSVEENSDDELADAETLLLSNPEIYVKLDLMTSTNHQEINGKRAMKQKSFKSYWEKFAASNSESSDFDDDPEKKDDKKNVESEKIVEKKKIEMKKMPKKNFWDEFDT